MNKQLLKCLICGFFALLVMNAAYARSSHQISPVGFWTTISDEDNKPRSVVQITRNNGVLEGEIIKIYSKPDDHALCIKCSGTLKNNPIIGMRIMWDLKPDGALSWSGGKILDPKKGKIYKCIVELNKKGNKLFVRGYIGISLFGRTQTWIKRNNT